MPSHVIHNAEGGVLAKTQALFILSRNKYRENKVAHRVKKPMLIRRDKTKKKVKVSKRHIFGRRWLLWIGTFVLVGGGIALIRAFAAVPLVVDNSVPQPVNVQVYPDDRNLIVTWNDTRPAGVVGYYLQYKKKGAANWENVKQTIHNSIQLQPLAPNTEYEITVQSARGNYLTTGIGSATKTNTDSSEMYWARADGHVSQPVTVNGSTTDARVNDMRNRLTGFFDSFTEPANPFDEKKWNQAAFCNSAENSNNIRAGSALAFINPQFHSHNGISCEFGGIVSRPRATFDTSVGVNGGPLSESNPAQVEFDMDLMVDSRSKWYLDFVPVSARYDGSPTDMNGHHSADDTTEHNEPGNTLRFDVNGAGFGAVMTYWDVNRNFRQLFSWEAPSTCGNWSPASGNSVDFRAYNGCQTNNKTLNQSPVPEQSLKLLHSAQNVRRHWVMQFTPTKVKIFVDGTQIMQASLPADWSAEKRYTLQNTMFTYNTAKQYATNIENIGQGDYMGRHGVIPRYHFYHWDNFGFTGPAPTTVVHNYIDTDQTGKLRYLNDTGDMRQRDVTSVIKVPDTLGNPVNGKAKLYVTATNRADGYYTHAPGDHLLFNGKRYDVPDASALGPHMGEDDDGVTYTIPIDLADIKQGDNIVQWKLYGVSYNAIPTNVHLEFQYPKGSEPGYTQPIDIYHQSLSNVVEPPMTNCDQWIYVEQDLGLPLLGGKQNVEPAPCYYLSTMANHSGHGGGDPTPVPTPDSTPPVVELVAPGNNTQLSGNTVTARATAADLGGINRVEFYIGTVRVATDTTSPYQTDLDFTSYAPGSYGVSAVAYDNAGLSTQTGVVTVTKPQPADTSPPTVTLTAPAANYAVPQGTDNLNFSVNATDNVGVTRVDLYVDSSLVRSMTTPSSGSTYNFSFQAGSLQPGSHSWQVRAYDAAGLERISSSRSFTIPTAPLPDPNPNPNPDPTPIPDPNPAPGKECDLNGDGKVGLADLAILLGNYNRSGQSAANGDFTKDGRINIADLAYLLGNYGK